MKASKMAVVFGKCGRECLSVPGNTGCGGRTHSPSGEGGGGQYFGRRKTQLCTLPISNSL